MALSWYDIREFSTERVLRWGYPLWDEEKVKEWELLNEGEAVGEPVPVPNAL